MTGSWCKTPNCGSGILPPKRSDWVRIRCMNSCIGSALDDDAVVDCSCSFHDWSMTRSVQYRSSSFPLLAVAVVSSVSAAATAAARVLVVQPSIVTSNGVESVFKGLAFQTRRCNDRFRVVWSVLSSFWWGHRAVQ